MHVHYTIPSSLRACRHKTSIISGVITSVCNVRRSNIFDIIIFLEMIDVILPYSVI